MIAFFVDNSFNIFLAVVLFPHVSCDEDDREIQELLDFIPELYLKYREAFDSDQNTISIRRTLGNNNKEYNIHVNKLRDVNGLKRHNLIIKEKSNSKPLIYINNPVETKIPNAYISYEEFKSELTGRILRQREEFDNRQHKTPTFATLKAINFDVKEKPLSPTRKLKTKRIRPLKSTNNPATILTKKPFNISKTSRLQHTTKTIATNVTQTSIRRETTLSETISVNTLKTPKFKPTEKKELSTKNSTNTKLPDHNLLRTQKQSLTAIKDRKPNIESINLTETQNFSDYTNVIENSHPTELINTVTDDTTTQISITEEEMTTTESTVEEVSTVKTTEQLITNSTMLEMLSDEIAIQTSTNEAQELNYDTNTSELTIQSTTEEVATDESTSDDIIDTTSTTKFKRITLGRPLVYMGGYRH